MRAIDCRFLRTSSNGSHSTSDVSGDAYRDFAFEVVRANDASVAVRVSSCALLKYVQHESESIGDTLGECIGDSGGVRGSEDGCRERGCRQGRGAGVGANFVGEGSGESFAAGAAGEGKLKFLNIVAVKSSSGCSFRLSEMAIEHG